MRSLVVISDLLRAIVRAATGTLLWTLSPTAPADAYTPSDWTIDDSGGAYVAGGFRTVFTTDAGSQLAGYLALETITPAGMGTSQVLTAAGALSDSPAPLIAVAPDGTSIYFLVLGGAPVPSLVVMKDGAFRTLDTFPEGPTTHTTFLSFVMAPDGSLYIESVDRAPGHEPQYPDDQVSITMRRYFNDVLAWETKVFDNSTTPPTQQNKAIFNGIFLDQQGVPTLLGYFARHPIVVVANSGGIAVTTPLVSLDPATGAVQP